MADFINVLDALGDNTVIDSIIDKTITEFKDDSIETVGRYAFYKCTALKSVVLPKVTAIGNFAFADCSGLAELELPSLTSIPDSCNWGDHCAVEKLKLPSIETIGVGAFQYWGALRILDLYYATSLAADVCRRGCDSLIAVILRSTDTIAALGSTAFSNECPIYRGTGYIYVPAALVDSYKAATNWSTYAAQFRALEDYTVDGTTTGELDETKI